MPLLDSIASAIANVFGLVRDRSSLRNAPPMQANANAKQDATIKREATRIVAEAKTGDPEAMRKLREAASE